MPGTVESPGYSGEKTDKEDPGFSGAYIFVEGAESELYIETSK